MGHPAKTLADLHHPDHGSYEGHVVPGEQGSSCGVGGLFEHPRCEQTQQ